MGWEFVSGVDEERNNRPGQILECVSVDVICVVDCKNTVTSSQVNYIEVVVSPSGPRIIADDHGLVGMYRNDYEVVACQGGRVT